ncbi:MAG: hypothetical protein DMF13_08175 [Verrucomicrobia bacterium]|nr:MAG: hypothetical protein DMF13_08175 [Verrucomicrobiota bacterium]
MTDIFAVESDIAKTIADTLQAKLTGSEKQMIAAQPTSDTAAYELYHKGRSLWEKRSGDNTSFPITRPRPSAMLPGKPKRPHSKLSGSIPISPKRTPQSARC